MVKIKMIVRALEHYGNYKADSVGFSAGEKYWDIAKEISDLFNIYELETEQTENNGQLTVKDILKAVAKLDEIMETEDILNLPVYIGDDDELNGIHCAWYSHSIDTNNDEDADFVELINENSGNNPLKKGKAFLIS